MPFRDELAAAQARVANLERENAELREEIARLSGRAPLDHPVAQVAAIGGAWWTPGRIVGWSRAQRRLAYVGGVDPEAPLRVVAIGEGVVADYLLARETRDFVDRVGRDVVVQLGDGRLVAVAWDEAEISARSLSLTARLRAPVRVDRGSLWCATDDERVHQIDAKAWAIVATTDWARAPAGLLHDERPHGLRRELRLGDRSFDTDLEVRGADGWKVAGLLPGIDGGLVCIFDRVVGGAHDMAVGLTAPPRKDSSVDLTWFTRLGAGEPFRASVVDGLVATGSLGIGSPEVTVAVDLRTGGELFRITGSFSSACWHGPDGTVAAV